MSNIQFFSGEQIPLEMHKVRIVQKLQLLPIEERLLCIKKAGNNTFLLNNRDVFLDMLTDSGVNAMSDRQLGAMMVADDSYAGSETYVRLEEKIRRIFGTEFFLPAHQGRACENILAQVFVKPGMITPMNYHFTTTKAHITLNGGSVEELLSDRGTKVTSQELFKGNMDIEKLENCIARHGSEKIAFVRMEAGTNLIGGQPFSLANLQEVNKVCAKHQILLVLDASLLADNLHFMKEREEQCKSMSIREITLAISSLCDITYFSARKLGFAKGGGICMHDRKLYLKMRELITLYEGFLTYGGMSVREMEALTVGLDETMEEDVISQGPQFIAFMTDELVKRGVPVVTPAGGLGCHLDAMAFVDQIPQQEYPAGALAAALYLAGGVRGMERGTMSEQRDPAGNETLSTMELLRLAVPRRVFTLSQIKYAIDRIAWLHQNRHLVGGLEFVEEPKNLRFFFGRLQATSDWQENLVHQFRNDFPDSL
ncbi:MAG: tryptophanase [Negativicutes bacterium]|nr:tryptophanase [Negativicutes bacterium]